MTNRTSPLSKEAYAELEVVAREKPHWKQHEQLAEATRRAAEVLAIPVGTTAQPRTAATQNRERLRTAQGGPVPNRQATNKPAAITPELQRIARKTAGSELPPEVLARVAKTVAANQRRSTR